MKKFTTCNNLSLTSINIINKQRWLKRRSQTLSRKVNHKLIIKRLHQNLYNLRMLDLIICLHQLVEIMLIIFTIIIITMSLLLV